MVEHLNGALIHYLHDQEADPCLMLKPTPAPPDGIPAVGYALAQEITANRPPKPGPEWWLLMDLALDADDVTRRTACGYKYMAERTQAPRSTIFRWLKKLADDGLIKTVQHSKSAGCGGGKGERAVYEIQVPPRLAARIAATLNQVPSIVRPDSVLRSHKKGPDSGSNEVSSKVGPDYPDKPDISSNQVSPAVGPPPYRTPSGVHLWKVQTYGQIKIAATRRETTHSSVRSAEGTGRAGRTLATEERNVDR